MQVMQNLSPDSFTLVSVISALAELSMPRQAKWIHRLDEKHVSTWNAMIDGYGTHSLWEEIHNNLAFAKKATKKVFELFPDDGGYHVLLANIYATDAKWDKAASVRNSMDRTGIRKTPGCSLVDLRNEIHLYSERCSGNCSIPSEELAIAFALLNTAPGTTAL
ncbi:hypothetical protein Leryth_023746 [Lithospermum erythrorhizon]|nr:hypothetical protein Leryth_023746 [Lithospermum erythrorhizon]